MKKCTILTALILSIFLLSIQVQAKWWIFGQNQDEITLSYLYINNISFDEGGEEITLYRQYLEEGNIMIKGKASIKKGGIGSVQISIDGKESWKKAELSKDGAFVLKFKPEIEKAYEIYVKILTTSGKSNDFEETRKIVTVSNQDIRAAVSEVLNKLTESYMSKNAIGFMDFISDDFAGDFTLLDRAVRKDFSLFDNIDLRFVLTTIASDSKGGVYAAITYNRFLIGARDGQTYSDKGMTEFSFIPEGRGLKVKSMKNPLIFGLSDAANIGTGTVLGSDEPIISVDSRGNINLKPLSQTAGDSDDSGIGGDSGDVNGIPTPENLYISDGTKHHYIDLEFDWTGTWDELMLYEVIVEEAFSENGPWTEVDLRPGDNFIRITTDAIAQQAAILYYRVRLTRDGKTGAPSNVATWDNN